jgi:hypothetical protein
MSEQPVAASPEWVDQQQSRNNLIHLPQGVIVSIIGYLPALSDTASLQLVSKELLEHCIVSTVDGIIAVRHAMRASRCVYRYPIVR